MARRTIEVPLVPRLIKRVEQIITENGLARMPIIKGDTIEAFGEAGIKQFYIYVDDVIDDDTAILIIDANNRQSLDIISSLVQSGIEDSYAEFKKKEKNREKDAKLIRKETKKTESEKKCFACEGALKDLGIKELAEGLRAKIVVCQECGRLDFYKE